MDDLREVQTVFCGETGTNSDICVPINVYADTRTMTSVNRTYPYLMGNVSRAGKVPTFVREQEKEEAVGKEGEEKGEEKECNQVEKDSNNENEKGSGVNDISTENSSEPTKSEETNVEGVKEKIEEIVEENGSVESSIFWTDPSCQLETEEESEMAEKGKVSERATTIYRWVAKFNWFTFDENPFYSFYVEGLRFTPLPVLHGDDYISYGQKKMFYLHKEKKRKEEGMKKKGGLTLCVNYTPFFSFFPLNCFFFFFDKESHFD